MNALRLVHWTDWKVEWFFIFKFLRELGNWICMCGPGILEFANRACLPKVHYKIMRESSNPKLQLLRKVKFTAAAKHFAPFCATLITKVFLSASTFHAWSVGRSRRTPGKTDAFQEFYNLFFQPAQNARWTPACAKVAWKVLLISF